MDGRGESDTPRPAASSRVPVLRVEIESWREVLANVVRSFAGSKTSRHDAGFIQGRKQTEYSDPELVFGAASLDPQFLTDISL